MGENSKIEWTDCTDNIIVVKGGGWWCRKISPGCENCYAAALNQSSYFGGNKLPYTGQPPELELRRDILAKWARQTRPRKHFVASMTDVFGDWVPEEWSMQMLDAMEGAPRQTFQVLTKRPDVARARIRAWLEVWGWQKLPDNIWIGTTVEDQTRAEQRIPELMSIPARVRFLSCEPLLSRLDLGPLWHAYGAPEWVICGGESGCKARPMHPMWARDLLRFCEGWKVPFFFKQWGEWTPGYYGGGLQSLNMEGFSGEPVPVSRVGKKQAGRALDGREWSEFPATS